MSNNPVDLADLEWDPSKKTVTAWSTHVLVRNGKSRRTYSRRGSTGTLPFAGKPKRTEKNKPYQRIADLEEVSDSFFQEEEQLGDKSWGDEASPSFSDAPQQSSSGLSIGRPPPLGRATRSNASIDNRMSYVPATSMVQRSVSLSSCSYSRSSSVATDLSENVDPNLDPLEANASPKRAATLEGDKRGRKKVRSQRNLGRSKHKPLAPLHSNSFSDLARCGEGGISWARPCSDASPVMKPHFSDLGYLTDATASSPATTSVGSLRKRGVCGSPIDDFDDCSSAGGFSVSRPSFGLGPPSRSRSRMFSPPTSRLSAFSLSADDEKKNRAMDLASDDGGDSEPESVDGDDSGDDASVESAGFGRSTVPAFAAHPPKQKRRSCTETIFATSAQDNLEEGDVFGSMSSYQDLKFLIRALRSERNGSHQSWHVAPPAAWRSTRRAAFFQWTTRSLGFTMRTGGMTLSYLQISKSKGADVLKLLESARSSYKAQGSGKTATNPISLNPSSVKNQMDLTASSRKLEQARSSQEFELTLETNELTHNAFSTSSQRITKPDIDIVESCLVQEMMSLEVNESTDGRINRPDTAERRLVIDTDLSPLKESARPSLENHTTARDLMLHLHGMSPVRSKTNRPPKLSLHSLGSQSSGSAGACKHIAASPYPQAPSSTLSQTSHIKSFQYDFVETPMVKQQEHGWGSCPVNGRDWGTSECCSDSIINEMFQRFQQSHGGEGNFASPYLLPLHVSSATRSADLCLDLEAVSSYREQAESPTSVSNSENDGVCMYDEIGLEGSSPEGSEDHLGRYSFVDRQVVCSSNEETQTRELRRRRTAFAKHKRMSLMASVMNPKGLTIPTRKSLFIRPSRSSFVASEQTFLDTVSLAPSVPPSELSIPRVKTVEPSTSCMEEVLNNSSVLEHVLSYLDEFELLCTASLVCSSWADVATYAHANLMLMSVGCLASSPDAEYESDEETSAENVISRRESNSSMNRSWQYLTSNFPWACFLSEGAFKRVYKVYNDTLGVEEAVSVMDVDLIAAGGQENIVGAELAVSVMLSSLVRRGICPNFVATRSVFSCPYEPPATHWGSVDNKRPKGDSYITKRSNGRRPREPGPKHRGRYQYIRMELCDEGDVEEFLKRQSEQAITPDFARQLLFQISYAIHAAADRFSLKHYDVKLLNIFLQHASSRSDSDDVVLRYGLGAHMFALKMQSDSAVIAKLADYGTANVEASSNGQPVTIAQFTTLENTPPEFMINGDSACQGHSHDYFGLGLCMLHLFTGFAPYEEILEDVTCPVNLKNRLRRLWEDENVREYSVVRSVVLSDVYTDEDGNIVEGEPDDVLYDTLYRYLVLFGVPDQSQLGSGRVWDAINLCLQGNSSSRGKAVGKCGRTARKRDPNDATQYCRDRKKFSLSHGNNKYIARARRSLEAMDGGMELLKSLVCFDPQERASALDVLNSSFMAPLREIPGEQNHSEEDTAVYSYTAFSTQT